MTEEESVCTDTADCGGQESGKCVCGACDCNGGIYGELDMMIY